jgi:hypothetical protein
MRLTTLLALLLLMSPALPSSELPLYDVELLIFDNPEAGAESEGNPSVGEPPDLSKAEAPPAQARTHRLEAIGKQLMASNYLILQHLSWRQRLSNDSRGKPIKIQSNDDKNRLSGIVSLSREDLADLELDLLLLQDGRAYRLKGSRRMRRNEIHYLDHPKLGVIATITRVE